MMILRFERRTFGAGDRLAFWLASRKNLAVLEAADGPSELTYIVYAATQEDAMQQYYDREGWGTYKAIPGIADRAFSSEMLDAQLADFPEDTELRRLNGMAS